VELSGKRIVTKKNRHTLYGAAGHTPLSCLELHQQVTVLIRVGRSHEEDLVDDG
jgi:hypothetical protein